MFLGAHKMKVKCLENTGENLSFRAFQAGYQRISSFQIRLNAIYIVYGMSLWKGNLHYLIIDPDHYIYFPEWIIAELFEVVDPLLPIDWFFRCSKGENGEMRALWGYQEMIIDDNHYYDLMDHKDHAMRVFLKRKLDIDGQ